MRLDEAAFGNGMFPYYGKVSGFRMDLSSRIEIEGIGKFFPSRTRKYFIIVRGEWERDKESSGNIPTCQTIENGTESRVSKRKKGGRFPRNRYEIKSYLLRGKRPPFCVWAL